MTRSTPTTLLSIAIFTMALSVAVSAEPVVELRLGTARFPAGSSLVVPAGATDPLTLWLDDVPSAIQVGTVRVLLNGMPMNAFMSVNRLLRGIRVVVRMDLSFGAEFTLRRNTENVLSFSAIDEVRVTYNATFYLRPDDGTTAPKLATFQRAAPGAVATAPKVAVKPVVTVTTDVPAMTTAAVLEIGIEATDEEGLLRVVVEVNGREEDAVLLQNGRPVRQRRGWTSPGSEPGTVDGDSRQVRMLVPVPLRKNAINVVVAKAEDVTGLISRVDRTVQTPR